MALDEERGGGAKCIKSMTQYASWAPRGEWQKAQEQTQEHAVHFCSLFLILITLKFSGNHSFHGGWWQYNHKSLPVSTVHELYGLIESVFTVCPAPPGKDYINSISLAQPEYQHHRLDFPLPCLPESGPENNIYTICAFRKLMMVSKRGAADRSFSCGAI